jgi:hypothetical protein
MIEGRPVLPDRRRRGASRHQCVERRLELVRLEGAAGPIAEPLAPPGEMEPAITLQRWAVDEQRQVRLDITRERAGGTAGMFPSVVAPGLIDPGLHRGWLRAERIHTRAQAADGVVDANVRL